MVLFQTIAQSDMDMDMDMNMNMNINRNTQYCYTQKLCTFW